MGRVFSLSRRAPRSPETGARAGPHRGHHAPTPYLAQGAGVRSWCRCPGVHVGTCALDSRAVIPSLEYQGLKRTPESRRSESGYRSILPFNSILVNQRVHVHNNAVNIKRGREKCSSHEAECTPHGRNRRHKFRVSTHLLPVTVKLLVGGSFRPHVREKALS